MEETTSLPKKMRGVEILKPLFGGDFLWDFVNTFLFLGVLPTF